MPGAFRRRAAASRAETRTPPVWRDLGNLLLMWTMLWAYVAFVEFLIIWAENLPREVAWFVPRLERRLGRRRHRRWRRCSSRACSCACCCAPTRTIRAGSRASPAVAAVGQLLNSAWLVVPSVDAARPRSAWWLVPALAVAMGLPLVAGLARHRAGHDLSRRPSRRRPPEEPAHA